MADATRVGLFGVGSTNFMYGIGRPADGQITEVSVEPSRPHELETQVTHAIGALNEDGDRPLDAIALATPGLVEKGTVCKFDTPDGEVIDRIDIGATVEREFGLPVHLENDCTAAALAEWYYGEGRGADCVAHVTFGTGIGGGVVASGNLLRGETGHAAEFGLISLAPDSDLQSGGVPGAWEAFCSGRGIPKHARHRLAHTERPSELRDRDELTAQMVFTAAENGDAFADDLLARVGRLNAAGIGAIANAVNPGIVTLGGGVALNNPDRILAELDRHLARYCFVDPPEVRMSTLREEIGLYGALGTYVQQARTAGTPAGNVRATTDD